MFAQSVTSNCELCEEIVDLHSMLHFVHTLLYSLQHHYLELSKLVCRHTAGASCMIGSKSGMVLIYKYMHELGLQNE
jgi:hypothetical protein